MSRNWGRMAKYLRMAKVGHCDLQHGNVLLVPGANANSLALKLIDYDGMWVPALAGTKSGEVGHASYQHPRRLREATYSIDVDRFPVLLIATALRALQVKGRALWEKYDNGDNLLFKEADLLEPLKSHLFLDLTKTGDALVRRMMDFLVLALRGSVENAPLLEDVVPEALAGSSGSHPAIRQSGTTVRQVPAPATLKEASPAPAVMPPGADNVFDFGASAPAAPAIPSTGPKPARATRMAGVPVWAWAAAITLLLFIVGFVGGLAIWAFSGNPNTQAQDARAIHKDKDTPPTPNPTNSTPEKPGPTPNPTDPNPEIQGPTPLLLKAPFAEEEAKSAQVAWAKHLARKVEEEIDLGGGVRLVVVLIPPGTFTMGSPQDEQDRNWWENVQRLNGARSFFVIVQRYESSEGQGWPVRWARTGSCR